MAEIWNCSNAEYHADTSKVGSSMLRVALESPGRYRDRFVNKTEVREQTPAMLLGNVVHTLVLEPDAFPHRYYVRPEGIDGRTTKGKATLAALHADNLGKEMLDVGLRGKAGLMAKSVLSVPEVASFIKDGVIERGIVWEEDGLSMKCRNDIFLNRPDLAADLVLDLKTSGDPTPENWRRDGEFGPVYTYGYDIQGSHYCRGTEAHTGRPCTFGAIVVGKTSPYDVYLYDLAFWMSYGSLRRRRALRLIKNGPSSGWTRPEQSGVIQLAPSPYLNTEE